MRVAYVKFLKALVSVILFVTLFYLIPYKELLTSIQQVNVFYLLIPIVCFYLGLYISMSRWYLILAFYGLEIRKFSLLKLYLRGSFYNNFLPSTIGGDAYKLYVLNEKFKNSFNKIASSIILERGFGVVAWLCLAFLGFGFFYDTVLQSSLLYALFIMFCILIIALFIFLFLHLFMYTKIITFKENRFLGKIITLIDSLMTIRHQRMLVARAICLSLGFSLLSAVSMWGLFSSLGYGIYFPILIFVSAIINIAGMIPISLNNIGVSESLYVVLFSLFGVPPAVSLLAALLGRVSLMLSSSVGAFVTPNPN